MALFNRKKTKLKTEQELLERAKKDSRFFGPVYKKYHEQIFRFVYQRMDSVEDASDITSQVFLKALINLKKYEHRGFPFSSWLYKIALNEVNQFYRLSKNKRTVNVEEVQLKHIIEETNNEFDEKKRTMLLQVLSELSTENLQLIEMRYFEKRSFKEIGEILNITENNAKVKTYRVLDDMKKKIV